jgi:hypothetical protein
VDEVILGFGPVGFLACEILFAPVAQVSFAISCLQIFFTPECVCTIEGSFIVDKLKRSALPCRKHLSGFVLCKPFAKITRAARVKIAICFGH